MVECPNSMLTTEPRKTSGTGPSADRPWAWALIGTGWSWSYLVRFFPCILSLSLSVSGRDRDALHFASVLLAFAKFKQGKDSPERDQTCHSANSSPPCLAGMVAGLSLIDPRYPEPMRCGYRRRKTNDCCCYHNQWPWLGRWASLHPEEGLLAFRTLSWHTSRYLTSSLR